MMAASLPLATTGRCPPSTSNHHGERPCYYYTEDPTAWCEWTHDGHRLWAFMPVSFWVYTFKVLRCPYPSNHAWTSCPYVHHGERNRRRDPSRFTYSPVGCRHYGASKKRHELAGSGAAPTCARGRRCGFAHGSFEKWLHPARFRTQMCVGGVGCARRICFFAHYPAQLRNGDEEVPVVSFPPAPPPNYVPRALQVPTLAFSRRRSASVTTTAAAAFASAPVPMLQQLEAPLVYDDDDEDLDRITMMRGYLASEEGSSTEG